MLTEPSPEKLAWTVARPLLAGIFIALLLGAGALVWSVREATRNQARDDIRADIASLLEQEDRLQVVAVIDAIDHRLSALPAERQPSIYLLTDPSGARITGNLAKWPKDSPQGEWFIFTMADADGSQTHVLASHLIVGGAYPLLVGRRLDTLDHILARLWLPMLAAAGIGSLLIGFSLWRSSRAVATEVRTIREVLVRARNGDLAARIGYDNGPHEFAQLAAEIDHMLDVIQRQVLTTRQAASQAAHELRTPLARMRTRLASSGEAQHVADLDDLIDLLQSILDLAEQESEIGTTGESVDLASVAAQVAELYFDVCADKGVSMRVSAAPANVVGDRGLLLRLIANLVDNAIRHTPEGGAVHIRTMQAGIEASVVVEDDGPGLGGRNYDELVGGSRNRGTGMGLRFARAIAVRHGGKMRASDRELGGAVFRCSFVAENAPRTGHGE